MSRGFVFACFAIALLSLAPREVFAACTSPAANIGSLDFQTSVFRYCDGTNWVSFGGSTSFPLQAPNGSAAAPSFSFSSQTGTGLYSPAAGTLALATMGTQRLTVDQNGNVGIGTTSPANALDVYSTTNAILNVSNSNPANNPYSKIQLTNYRGSWGAGDPAIVSYVARGASGAPSPVTSGMTLMSLQGRGYAEAGFGADQMGASIDFVADNNWGNSVVPAYMVFNTTPYGNWSTSERMRLTSGGSLGIGTTVPLAKLHVSGAIKSTGQIATGSQTITSGATSTIDWDNGNAIVTNYACGSNLTMNNFRDGGSYTLVITDTGTTQCNFNATTTGSDAATVGYHFKPTNAARTATSHTVYTLIRAGTLVYVSWSSGF